MGKTRTTVFSNLIWRMMERFGAHGVTFIVEIILARLLDPEVYGALALVTVFTAILQVFVDSGLGNALIQKKNADDLDFSSVFFFNLIICTSLYLLVFFLSPKLAAFYERPELCSVIRVMSVVLIISGLKNVQQAYISKHLMFKKFFFSTLGGTIGAAVIGVFLAYKGFGIWALVAQNVFNQAIDTIILWVTVHWRPKLMFSGKRLISLLKYGWKLLVSSLLEVLSINLRSLIIGKIYTTGQLAFFNRGQQFPQLIVSNVNSAIDSVLFPVLSDEQEDAIRLKSMTRRAIKTSAFIMYPCMVGIAACAKPLVIVLLTEKWLPCVAFLRIYCIVFAMYPFHTANLNVIKACGRSDVYLALEIIKKILDISVLLLVMNNGVYAIAISAIVCSLVSLVINTYPNREIIDYGVLSQVKDILPEMLASLMMGMVVYTISLLHLPILLILILQIIVGIIVYIAISKMCRLESYYYCLDLIMGFLKSKGSSLRNRKYRE